jgi:hypothetical protein
MGRKNNAIAEMNNKRFDSQTSKCFKQQMFITWPLGPNTNTKNIKGTTRPTIFRLEGHPPGSIRKRKSMKSLARMLVAGVASASTWFIATSSSTPTRTT